MPVVKFPSAISCRRASAFSSAASASSSISSPFPWILSLVHPHRRLGARPADPAHGAGRKGDRRDPDRHVQVAWMRLVLLGPQRGDRLPGLGWSRARRPSRPPAQGRRHHFRACRRPSSSLSGSHRSRTMRRRCARPIPSWRGARRWQRRSAPDSSSRCLLALRVSFGLAATAVDLPLSPRRSWAYGRGNGWTIIGALFLILLRRGPRHHRAAIVPLRPDAHRARRPGGRRHRHLDGRDPGFLRQRRPCRDDAGRDLARLTPGAPAAARLSATGRTAA